MANLSKTETEPEGVMRYSRRRFLASTALAGVAHVAGVGLAAEPAENTGRRAITRQELDDMQNKVAGSHLTCVRTPESNDGPYYYESSPARRHITEGRKGMPLRLGITVLNVAAGGCARLPDAIVDVWQADADGMYSNVGSDLQPVDTLGQTFMRGHQATDSAGYVEFETVVPGWELVGVPPPRNVVLRATHIHVKVFQEHKVATTQLYLPDRFLDELYVSADPYRTHRKMTAPGVAGSFERIRNTQDRIFIEDQSKPMEMRREGDGIFAEATIGIVSLGSRGVPSLFR
jgi:protocatechuate 3,4-dioxygenase beta subunit